MKATSSGQFKSSKSITAANRRTRGNSRPHRLSKSKRSESRGTNSLRKRKPTKRSELGDKVSDAYTKIMDMVEKRAADHSAYFLHIAADDVALKAALDAHPSLEVNGCVAVVDAKDKIVAFNDQAQSLQIRRSCPIKLLLREHSEFLFIPQAPQKEESIRTRLEQIFARYPSSGSTEQKGQSICRSVKLKNVPESQDRAETLRFVHEQIASIKRAALDEVGIYLRIGFGHSESMARASVANDIALERAFNAGIDQDEYLTSLMHGLELTDLHRVTQKEAAAVFKELGTVDVNKVRESLPLLYQRLVTLKKEKKASFAKIACLVHGIDPVCLSSLEKTLKGSACVERRSRGPRATVEHELNSLPSTYGEIFAARGWKSKLRKIKPTMEDCDGWQSLTSVWVNDTKDLTRKNLPSIVTCLARSMTDEAYKQGRPPREMIVELAGSPEHYHISRLRKKSSLLRVAPADLCEEFTGFCLSKLESIQALIPLADVSSLTLKLSFGFVNPEIKGKRRVRKTLEKMKQERLSSSSEQDSQSESYQSETESMDEETEERCSPFLNFHSTRRLKRSQRPISRFPAQPLEEKSPSRSQDLQEQNSSIEAPCSPVRNEADFRQTGTKRYMLRQTTRRPASSQSPESPIRCSKAKFRTRRLATPSSSASSSS